MFEDDIQVLYISEEHDSDEDDEVKKEKEEELELFEQHEQLWLVLSHQLLDKQSKKLLINLDFFQFNASG